MSQFVVKKGDGVVLSTWPVALQYFGEWIFSAFKVQLRARSLSYVTLV